MLQFLKADTETKVVIGPAVDKDDGLTPETTLAISSADEAELMKHNASSVTDISTNTWSAITNADGYYNLTLTTENLDTEGRLTVLINDDSLCLPLRADFMVVNANVYDSLFAAAGTDKLDVQVAAFDANAITTASINNGALTSAKFGADFLTDAKIADGAFKGEHFATDCLTSTALAADAAGEIADAVWDEATTGHTTAGTFGEQCKTDIDAILADTNELQTDDVPGLISALNDPTAAAIADSVWDEATSGHTTAGTFGEQCKTDIDAILADVTGLNGDAMRGTDNAFLAASAPTNFSDLSITASTGRVDVASIEGSDATDQINSACDTALSDINLDHLMKTAVANNADMTAEVVDGTVLSNIMSASSDTSTYVVADDSLQGISEGAAGGGATAQEVWEYATRVLTGNTNLNDISAADVDAEVDEAIENYGLDHLVHAAVVGTDITNNSIVAKLVSKSATADWDDYDNTTDSLQALRDNQGTGALEVATGTVGSTPAPAATVFGTNLSEADDVFDGLVIVMTSGNCDGQAEVIGLYENSNGKITLNGTFTTAPADGDTFSILAIPNSMGSV